AGVLRAKEASIVQKVFRLSGRRISDCMVPRDRMVALDLRTAPEGVLEVARRYAHTRMPVYDGTIDNIVGIVNAKDLLYLFGSKELIVLDDAVYPPLFLKPEDDVASGIELFRKASRPMALVRDETGKILGLVTLEDLLEEIVGEIEDEHDRPTREQGLQFRRPDRSVKVAVRSDRPGSMYSFG